MKDANYNFTKALPNAASNNNTPSIDLGNEQPFTTVQRRMHIQVDVPALSDHTNTGLTNTLTLQDSADNSSFANTQPLIQVGIPGVASTGSPATSVKVPLPPGVRRYVRFNQTVPTGAGTGSNAVVNYDVVT